MDWTCWLVHRRPPRRGGDLAGSRDADRPGRPGARRRPARSRSPGRSTGRSRPPGQQLGVSQEPLQGSKHVSYRHPSRGANRAVQAALSPEERPSRANFNETPPRQWPPRANFNETAPREWLSWARFSETTSWMPSQRIWPAAGQRRAAGPSLVRRDNSAAAGSNPSASATNSSHLPRVSLGRLAGGPSWVRSRAVPSGVQRSVARAGLRLDPARTSPGEERW
jgi:hypothetical protein